MTVGRTKEAPQKLQFLRATIDNRNFNRWMGERRLLDPDHAMHCLLAECFGAFRPKPFRHIIPRNSAKSVLYGYGEFDLDRIYAEHAACADPLQDATMPARQINCKPMPTNWRVGLRLGFEARVRPIVRVPRTPRSSGIQERDLYQHAAMKLGTGKFKPSREEVYVGWLAKQIERIGGAGLEIQSTKLVEFQRIRSIRRLGQRQSEGPDAVVRGVLVVTDSNRFLELLARGIGRHRAFGFGMILLRPTPKHSALAP